MGLPARNGRPRQALAVGAAVLCCVLVTAVVARRIGHPRTVLRALWDGDQEARAKARQLGNVAGARDYIDELTEEVEGLEEVVENDAQTRGREAAQIQHAKLGASLGKSVTDVLMHLDKVTGDEQVRAARKIQVERALALGTRIDSTVGQAAVDR